MWAQLIQVRLKRGKDPAEMTKQIRAAEQPGSGLIRTLMMRDQTDPTRLYTLVVFESEEQAVDLGAVRLWLRRALRARAAPARPGTGPALGSPRSPGRRDQPNPARIRRASLPWASASARPSPGRSLVSIIGSAAP